MRFDTEVNNQYGQMLFRPGIYFILLGWKLILVYILVYRSKSEGYRDRFDVVRGRDVFSDDVRFTEVLNYLINMS